jgi:hypothetical protein
LLDNLKSLCYSPADFTHPLIAGALLFIDEKFLVQGDKDGGKKTQKELNYGKYFHEVVT